MTDPEWFYHYTDTNGILGILKSKELWATNTNFLNDSDEMRKGIRYAKNWLEENKPYIIKNMGEGFSKMMANNLDDSPLKQCGNQMYSCSFSTEKDSNSQWQAYGLEAGYSIGFHINLLKKKSEELGLRFCQCVYDHDSSNNPVKTALNKLKESGHFNRKPSDSAAEYFWIEEVMYAININSAILKGKEFSNENEWRILPEPHPDLRMVSYHEEHRSVRDILVPYTKIQLFPANLDEAHISTPEGEIFSLRWMIGPTNSPELKESGLAHIIRKVFKIFRYENPQDPNSEVRFFHPEHTSSTLRNI